MVAIFKARGNDLLALQTREVILAAAATDDDDKQG